MRLVTKIKISSPKQIGSSINYQFEAQMKSAIIKFLRDEEGATAIEYGIIAGMMAVALVAIFGANGGLRVALDGVFGRIATALGGPAVPATTP